jgi:hypothetical protein
MTLGLYKVGEGRPIINLRRARAHFDGRIHVVPSEPPRGPSLCGGLNVSGRRWEWSDGDITCRICLARVRDGLRKESMVLAEPAVVAELQRQMLMSLSDRSAATRRARGRLAVEIYRPAGSVVGSPSTRRVIHLIDCPRVAAAHRQVVLLPVTEVRRQLDADGRQTDYCQECQPGSVIGIPSPAEQESRIWRRGERDYEDLSPEWTL